MSVTILLPWAVGNPRPWLARVLGADPTYGFAREWAPYPIDGRMGLAEPYSDLPDGFYEASVPLNGGESRFFFTSQRGHISSVPWNEWIIGLAEIWKGAPFFVASTDTAGIFRIPGRCRVSDILPGNPTSWVVMAVLSYSTHLPYGIHTLVVAAPQQR